MLNERGNKMRKQIQRWLEAQAGNKANVIFTVSGGTIFLTAEGNVRHQAIYFNDPTEDQLSFARALRQCVAAFAPEPVAEAEVAA